MKKLFFLIILICSYFKVEGSLRNLLEGDKIVCLDQLERASKEDLWDAFLEGQAKLFFESEIKWLTNQTWFQQAKNVLEFGSGNGAYLSQLAERFQDKTFHGIEKLHSSVITSNKYYSNEKVLFEHGDAEVFNDQLISSSDIVLFRLTLQHLGKPLIALNNTWHYLSSQGYVFIIDSCDLAKKT